MSEWWRSKNGPRHTISDGLRLGMGFYVGSFIMRVFVEGLLFRRKHNAATTASQASAPAPVQSNVCAGPTKAFEECLNTNGSNISACQSFMESLSECLKSSATPPIRVSNENAELKDVRVRVKFQSDKSDNP